MVVILCASVLFVNYVFLLFLFIIIIIIMFRSRCSVSLCFLCTVCPTRYRTPHFFNNSNTNEDIATKFEQNYVRCVRNEEECVRSVCP